MTAPTPTGDKVMMDLANCAAGTIEDTLEQKKIEMSCVEEEIDDLKNLSKGKRGDKADHKQRMQDVKHRLDDLEKSFSQTPEKKLALEEQHARAKEMKPLPVAPSPTAPTPSLGMTAPTASTCIDAKEPMMGGLVDGHHRKEAWVGGKLRHNWSEPENPDAVDFPQPTQT